jgi:ABC-type Fe3+-siderophore transport system permease subunit
MNNDTTPPTPQQPQYPPQSQQAQYPPQFQQPVMAMPPFNWLWPNILVTVLCCNLLAIIGIVFAAQVNGKFRMGDISGALSAAKTAKILFWVFLSLSLVGAVIYFLFAVLGIAVAAAVGH